MQHANTSPNRHANRAPGHGHTVTATNRDGFGHRDAGGDRNRHRDRNATGDGHGYTVPNTSGQCHCKPDRRADRFANCRAGGHSHGHVAAPGHADYGSDAAGFRSACCPACSARPDRAAERAPTGGTRRIWAEQPSAVRHGTAASIGASDPGSAGADQSAARSAGDLWRTGHAAAEPAGTGHGNARRRGA